MRQAVVVFHGMGEQIPMQTLEGFVEAVWTTDDTLVSPDKPDPNTGGKRTQNASWGKPDDRLKNDELRRITTEADKDGNYTDFFEYYWAHHMNNTTWEQVKAWILDLLWRNPMTRVPKRLLHVWIVLWILALIVLASIVFGLLPGSEGDKPIWLILVSWLFGLAVTTFVSKVLVKRFGDVARYVKALPTNVATRQKIRAGGVELLQTLTQSGKYDRIVIVAHSLGAIVAYDVLAHAFAAVNNHLDQCEADWMNQPERHRLEDMIRAAAGLPRTREQALGTEPVPPVVPLDVDAFQAQQAAALAEARRQGHPWLVTDFVTLGAPLTHAEFLMAASRDDMRTRQAARILPTCPPVLEYDGTTRLRHYSYGPAKEPEHRRVPHHAAHFAFTRWTNIYSDHHAIAWGDVISGPLGETFGSVVDGIRVQGIRDIAVLPARDPEGVRQSGHNTPFFVHNDYWNARKGSEATIVDVPHHIRVLREALSLQRQ